MLSLIWTKLRYLNGIAHYTHYTHYTCYSWQMVDLQHCYICYD